MRRRDRKCSIWFCEARSYALGFCMGHYQNLRRHGDVIAPSEETQIKLRDMCDDLASAAMEVIDSLSASACPACGSTHALTHKPGCSVDRLFALASRVKSVRATAPEESLAIEST